MLIKQVSIFGPVPLSYEEIADDESLGFLTAVINLVNEHKLQKPFHLSEDKELSTEDRTFICKTMKFDPRDRPTAKELLQDEWFRQEWLIDMFDYFWMWKYYRELDLMRSLSTEW